MIALLTDFGLQDAYVGVMKAVILSIAPSTQLVDITHSIWPQNVRQAAFTLLTTCEYFPAGTIFVVVVDPGVGGTRRAVAAKAGQYTFVGPDNGVFSYALASLGASESVELTNPQYRLTNVSNSFHGRDIFAPAAAHLVSGVRLQALGPTVNDLVALPQPKLTLGQRQITGEVLHIDHYGNIVTSVGQLQWQSAAQLALRPRFENLASPVSIAAERAVVQAGERSVRGIQRSFGDVAQGDLLAMVGSSGHLEIAVNHGNAAAQLGVSLGDEVVLSVG